MSEGSPVSVLEVGRAEKLSVLLEMVSGAWVVREGALGLLSSVSGLTSPSVDEKPGIMSTASVLGISATGGVVAASGGRFVVSLAGSGVPSSVLSGGG